MDISEVVKDLQLISTTGALSGEVSSVCYHSRSCEENSLFVAVSGLNADGHDFIDDAIRRGARWVVHEKSFVSPGHITSLHVSDSRRALGITGRNFYSRPSSALRLIGVTGTNGKTTVTYLLESIIATAGFYPGVLGTINYRFRGKTLPAPNTTPESLEFQKILRQMVDDGVSHCISEVSSHALDLGRVDDCDFDIAVFTNLSQDHLDYHLSMERYYEAKRRFFHELLPKSNKHNPYGTIINGDDPWGKKLIAACGGAGLTFGIDGSSDIRVEQFNLSLEGIEARVRIPGQTLRITSPLIGRFNLYNILAAAGAAFAVGISPSAIERGVASMKGVPGRMEKVSQPDEPHVFVDYAHTDDALRKAIENLLGFGNSRIITVFGCGGDRDQGKRPLMGFVAATLSDVVIVTSDNPRSEEPLSIIGQIEKGILHKDVTQITETELSSARKGKAYCIIPDRREAIETAVMAANPDDIVLIAGKGHEDYQIIGKERLFFDDRIAARESLAKRSEARL
ncbi:MAG TPA: UDP-N-acetylmuramoyl-L-alanyl-D-glutamate--2,6-diaminopimelate ligase [Syntrophales bacterium]|nr:UDP-N-acetylmuramoyl-L-alanyl-D-glutamate--2,6-diaminopimelate ligase [Syntrophales bacterium]